MQSASRLSTVLQHYKSLRVYANEQHIIKKLITYATLNYIPKLAKPTVTSNYQSLIFCDNNQQGHEFQRDRNSKWIIRAMQHAKEVQIPVTALYGTHLENFNFRMGKILTEARKKDVKLTLDVEGQTQFFTIPEVAFVVRTLAELQELLTQRKDKLTIQFECQETHAYKKELLLKEIQRITEGLPVELVNVAHRFRYVDGVNDHIAADLISKGHQVTVSGLFGDRQVEWLSKQAIEYETQMQLLLDELYKRSVFYS